MLQLGGLQSGAGGARLLPGSPGHHSWAGLFANAQGCRQNTALASPAWG